MCSKNGFIQNMLEDKMHSCQLSLVSKDSPEVQYNLVNWDPDNRNVLFINIHTIK